MRYLAKTVTDSEIIKQILLYDNGEEVYMFPFTSLDDGTAEGDFWFEEAFESCKDDYGIEESDWSEIPDPLEYCQHDWIQPVRILGRITGNPEYGRWERLVDGEWIEFSPVSEKMLREMVEGME